MQHYPHIQHCEGLALQNLQTNGMALIIWWHHEDWPKYPKLHLGTVHDCPWLSSALVRPLCIDRAELRLIIEDCGIKIALPPHVQWGGVFPSSGSRPWVVSASQDLEPGFCWVFSGYEQQHVIKKMKPSKQKHQHTHTSTTKKIMSQTYIKYIKHSEMKNTWHDQIDQHVSNVNIKH